MTGREAVPGREGAPSRADARLWAPERARLRPPPDVALIALTVLILGVSGGMLWLVGINYDGLTGSAAHKIHPATYLAVVLLAWTLVRAGNPLTNAVAALERRPASLLLCLAGIGLATQIVMRGGAGIAGALDTFLLPGLVAFLYIGCTARTMERIETTLHVVMAVNGALGIVEFVTGQRYFPYRLDGALLEYDTRAVALQGHPLASATLTSCYVIALAAGGGSLSALRRLGIIGLQMAALVTFGGRSGIVITLVLGGALGALGLVRAVMRGRIPLLAAAGAAFALPLLGLGLVVLANSGFFDALIGRFVNDGGSANARVILLDMFAKLSLRELVIGPDPAIIDSMRRINGLAMGLENPVIRIMLYQGAAMTALLTLALALFLYEIGRQCRPGIAMPMIAFVVLVNTYESLGGKTTLLAKFVILLLALFRKPDPPGTPQRNPQDNPSRNPRGDRNRA